MTDQTILRRHGLFSAKVPRYTSYPPANHFREGLGARRHAEWLAAVPAGSNVSLYIHIPFCRRLCWFCACRTQGTSTLRPVEAYVEVLRSEVARVAAALPPGTGISRLHLGGGTPTLLPAPTMALLVSDIFDRFPRSADFEFSVEVDPTEAAPELITMLGDLGLTRASVGVQDFDATVQKSIGRMQSYEVTAGVIAALRDAGVTSLNLDLLYGLPFQTNATLQSTLLQVAELRPDRIALYGYAHVPWMSKRQVMIPDAELPGPEARFALAELARDRLLSAGYTALGIDHFTLPHDSLALAAEAGTMRRNFQGYTDDPAPVLIGLGASAISRFPQGYVQNAVATSAYAERIETGGLAGHKGYALTDTDHVLADMIDALMCYGRLDASALAAQHPLDAHAITDGIVGLHAAFADITRLTDGVLTVDPAYFALTRIMAAHLDTTVIPEGAHSAAV